MKILKTHQTCPRCKHNGCLTVFEDGDYCFSCKTASSAGLKYEEVYVSHRGLTPDTQKKYCATSLVSSSGEVLARKYPYPTQEKYRWGKKDFSKNKGFKNNELFGLDLFDSTHSTLTIVEGEEDTMSAYQMLSKKFPVPVVGTPGSNIKKELLEKNYEKLDSFKKIVIVPDNDEAGKALVESFAGLFGHKLYVVKLDRYKDANEYLVNDAEKDFQKLWQNAKKYTDNNIYNTPDQFNSILDVQSSHEYRETPISGLNEYIKGLMKGHLTVITGVEGQGKTEVLRMFEHHMLTTYPDVKIATCHLEETKENMLRTLACYVLKEDVRDPDTLVPLEKIKEAINELTKNDNLYMFDFPESTDPMFMIDRVKYLAEACGCEFIFIDPIQQLAYSQGDDSEEQILSRLSVKLEKLASELNIGIVLTAHVNDDGQTRSSRMIGKSAGVRINLVRDHMNSDSVIRNTTQMFVNKNRPTARTGLAASVVFDPETFTISEG